MTADDVVLVYDGETLRLRTAPLEWWWELLEAVEDDEALEAS